MVVFAGGTVEGLERRLEELPPSAKLVFKVLELDAPLTQSQIAEQSRLSKRTTRHAIRELREADLIAERVYVPDARKRLYQPRAGGEE